MKKIAVVSLGCDKNRVDTERALASLLDRGWRTVQDPALADAIFINTCGFIESAKKESIETILEFAAYKQSNPELKLVVTGCLAQRYAADLKAQIPEIDILTGVNGYSQLPELLDAGQGESFPLREGGLPYADRELTTLPHYAYLKIAEGCDNCCTYCAIPRIRGRYRSYPMEYLLDEARSLHKQGVKELIVVAQDTTRYGIDLYGRYALLELLQALDGVGFTWVRVLYAYPELITRELLKGMRELPSVVPYLDVPLQHVDNGVLKRMNRRSDAETVQNLFKLIAEEYPELTLRSTFIAGFPGETEEEFETLKVFIAQGKVPYAGFFAYSREEDTPAYRMDGQIKAAVKRNRVRQLQTVQAGVTASFHDSLVGQELPVLYEGIDYKRGKFYGRAPFQTPEVDPVIYFTAPFPVQIGEIYTVRVVRGGLAPMGVALEKKECTK